MSKAWEGIEAAKDLVRKAYTADTGKKSIGLGVIDIQSLVGTQA